MKKGERKKTPEQVKTNNKALTFPMASNPLSKKKIIPRNEKKMPNPVNPSPISVACQNCKY